MSRPVAVVCVLLAGVLAAVQPPANASLSKLVGDVGAAFVSIWISVVFITVLLLVVGRPITAVTLDRVGWLGLHHVGLNAGRVLGIALVIAGTIIVTRT